MHYLLHVGNVRLGGAQAHGKEENVVVCNGPELVGAVWAVPS